jgi:hypothetical protein
MWLMKSPPPNSFRNTPVQYDLDALMHAAQALARPRDVIKDVHSPSPKSGAFLAFSASEAAPMLRQPPGAAVRLGDLRLLDRQGNGRASYFGLRQSRALEAVWIAGADR